MPVFQMKEREAPQPKKPETLHRFLEDEYALVHVNTAYAGVSLPPHLAQQPTVTLKISRLFRGRLTVDEAGFTAELLFNQSYFTCVVPFGAMWGMTSLKGQNVVWPEDVPAGVLDRLLAPPPGQKPPPPPAPTERSLLPVQTAPPAQLPGAVVAEQARSAGSAGAEIRRGHLRRVK